MSLDKGYSLLSSYTSFFKSFIISSSSGNLPSFFLENKSLFPSITSNTPPDEGIILNSKKSFLKGPTKTPKTATAFFSYPHDVQNSIDNIGFIFYLLIYLYLYLYFYIYNTKKSDIFLLLL